MKTYSALTVLILLAVYSSASADPAEVTFNPDRLRALGLDESAAKYFSQGPRFLPGDSMVLVKVNGEDKGMHSVRFSGAGEPCLSKTLLDALGIKTDGLDFDADGEYLSLSQSQKNLQAEADAREQSISIAVSQDILREKSLYSGYLGGGRALILNYAAYNNSYYSTRNVSNKFVNIDAGLNLFDWVVRSSQNVSFDSRQKTKLTTPYTYATKTFTESGRAVSVGQLSTGGTFFPGVPIRGIEIGDDQSISNRGAEVAIRGYSDTPHSKVNLYQSNRLIYSTLVGGGEFTLTSVPLSNYFGDVEVEVVSNGGAKKSYILKSADYLKSSGTSGTTPSLFSLGKIDLYGSRTSDNPYIAGYQGGFRFGEGNTISYGIMGAPFFYGAGAGITHSFSESYSQMISATVTSDNNHNRRGAKLSFAPRYAFTGQGLNLSANVDFTSAGYGEVFDSLRKENDYHNGRVSAGVTASWNSSEYGAFYVSSSRYNSSAGSASNNRVAAGWNRQFSDIGVSLSVQRSAFENQYVSRKQDSLFLNLTYKLGGHRINNYFRSTGMSKSAGVSTRGDFNDDSSWSVSAGQTQGNTRYNDIAGSANVNAHYTSVSLYGSATDNGRASLAQSVSGGIIISDAGSALSPYKFGDTVGIAEVSPPVTSVKISTPAGNVWTDWRGKAAIPRINPFRETQLEIDTEALSHDIDVSNGIAQIKARRGAVVKKTFEMQSTAGVILQLIDAKGHYIPKGSTISTDQGDYLTSAVEAGVIYLSQPKPHQILRIRHRDFICQAEVPEDHSSSHALKTVQVTCH